MVSKSGGHFFVIKLITKNRLFIIVIYLHQWRRPRSKRIKGCSALQKRITQLFNLKKFIYMAYPLCMVAQSYFDHQQAAGAATVRRDSGIFELIERQENKVGIANESELESLSGKTSYDALGVSTNCAIKVWYQKPLCSTKPTTKPALCAIDAKQKSTLDCVDVKIDLNCWRDIQVTPSDFNCVCGPNQGNSGTVAKARETLMMTVRERAKEIISDLNEAITVKALSAAGKYYANDAVSCVDSKANPRTINLFNVVNGQIQWNPFAINQIKKEYALQGYNGKVMVAGGGQLSNLEFQQEFINGVNQFTKAPDYRNFPIITGMDWGFDSAANSVLPVDSDYILTFTPGAYRWIPFYEFRNNVINEAGYRQTTITIDGYEFDWIERFDDCNTTWTVRLQKSGGLFCLPDSAYVPCGCHNHKLVWNIGCGTASCDDLKCPTV